MSSLLVIIGTGGNAADVLDALNFASRQGEASEVRGVLDDGRAPGSLWMGLPVLGGVEEATKFADCSFLIAVGSDRSFASRREILARAGVPSSRFATVVHPLASVSGAAQLGRGVCVNYGVSIGAGAEIGDHVLLGPRCIIGHDAVIESFSVIAPGAIVSGYVRAGPSCYIGAGATIRQRQVIGERALVGIGAVVVSDVAPGTTVVGNPARVLTPMRMVSRC
jgi:sugar O-acyltransferase (sialic acid O-acetyltransferase NeuD family)